MLPTTTDNGARLAAILPTGLVALSKGLGIAPIERLAETPAATVHLEKVPALRSFVMVVVDGLGHSNLNTVKGHAPTLARLQRRRLETVAPSTTGAALTTLTTGRLPGEHGLIGYRIRHPEAGLITTLKGWDAVHDRGAWQRAAPLFGAAAELGARAIAVGRPSHASGGLTEAILKGAEYLPGRRIEDRFSLVSRALRGGDPIVAYLYIDELDKAAHEHGWQSSAWLQRLEQFDSALDSLLRTLPSDVGVAITADHGIVDVADHQQIVLDEREDLMAGVTEVGGEPRFRSLYLDDGVDPETVASAWREAERNRAWVATRDEAISAGLFGPVHASVAPRLGEVLIAARKQVAYYLSDYDPRARAMVGQHGSLTDEERGIPLALAGALANSGFIASLI